MGVFIDRLHATTPCSRRSSACSPIADEAGISMVELALAWILRRPELASAIIGASRPEQVHANVAASGVELSQDTLDAIDEALGDVAITGQRLGPGFATAGRQAPARSAARARPAERPNVRRAPGGPVRGDLQLNAYCS